MFNTESSVVENTPKVCGVRVGRSRVVGVGIGRGGRVGVALGIGR